jgi:hypothetical protein
MMIVWPVAMRFSIWRLVYIRESAMVAVVNDA